MSESISIEGIPGPGQLPGVEGFFLLTSRGELGRYRSDGEFVVEKNLTGALSDKIGILLKQYRGGNTSEITLGLIMPGKSDHAWRCASLIYSENALREFYRTGNDPTASLTTFQKRNKIKSIFQGMEGLLDARELTEPAYPSCCPVLFVPEVDAEILRERYDLESVETGCLLEVLDLMALLPPEEKRHPYLAKMVTAMLRSRIAPEMRTGPDLMLAAKSGAAAEPPHAGVDTGVETPWTEAKRDRDISFNAGDPVTYWLLSYFYPFNELNDLQRQFIARGHIITKVKAGTKLIQRGSLEDLSIYLVEGTIELEAFDGKAIEIVGGSRRATLPISQLRPHAYTVRAKTNVTAIMVSQKMIREVTRITTTYRNRPGIEVSELTSLPDDVPGYHPTAGSRNS